MHISFAGPISTADISHLLGVSAAELPAGYIGAPFLGSLIEETLKQGHTVSAVTTDSTLQLSPTAIRRYANGAFQLSICPARPHAWRFNGRRLGRILDMFSFERSLIAIELRRFGADVIHAHWAYEFALAALATPIPTLLTLHDAPWVVLKHTRSLYRTIRIFMARKAMRESKFLTAPSDYLAQFLQPSCPAAIHVVPNPIADYVLQSGSARQAPSTRRIAMICNGWDSRKNPKKGIAAFARYRLINESAELHLYGQGLGAGQQGEAWASSHGYMAGCIFHGPTPHRTLIKELASKDLLLHPSLEESFGVVIAEAMALGIPVVAGKFSGAVPWVVGYDDSSENECSAVLTDVTSSLLLADAIKKAFDSNYSNRSKLGIERSQELFTSKAIVEKYILLYSNVLRECVHAC